MHIKNFRTYYLIAGVATTATWDDGGFVHLALLTALGLLIYLQLQISENRLFVPLTRFPQVPSTWKGRIEILSVGTTILIPYVFILTTSWGEEYPFLTDHTHHVMATIAAKSFWLDHCMILLLVFPGIYFAETFRAWKWWVWIAFCLFLFSGSRDGIPSFFSRYPALGYFIALPFNFVAHSMEWPTLLNVNRISHVASIAIWLFVLRPLVIKKWPDVSVLPYAIFVFFQKDMAYYFSSVFLEPWALIFLILAVEYAIRNPRLPEFAIYLVGAAALVKEQAIFCLPFFLLLFRPWQLPFRKLARLAIITAIAIFPFALYFQKRTAMQTWRQSAIADFSAIFSYERIESYGQRMQAQFGETGLLLIAVAGILIALAIFLSRKYGFLVLSFAAAGFFQIAYFFTDQISQSFTGYSRFSLVTIIFMGTPFLLVGFWLQKQKKQIILSLLALFIACLHLPVFLPFLQTYLQSPVTRNFFEHNDGPYHFPIHKIVTDAEKRGDLSKGQSIQVLFPLPTDRKSMEFIFPMAYPTLNRQYHILPEVSGESPDCHCHLINGAKIVLFVYYANLSRYRPDPKAQITNQKSCEITMRQSCQTVWIETANGNTLAFAGFGQNRYP